MAVEHHSGWISALLLADDVHAGPLRPDDQLFGCRGTEGIGGAEQDLLPLLLAAVEPILPMVVVLPTPLTPMKRTTAGLPLRFRAGSPTRIMSAKISFMHSRAPSTSLDFLRFGAGAELVDGL